MEIIELTRDNIDEYMDIIDIDMAENIDRYYFRGLVTLDGGEAVAAMIWEYLNVESSVDNESAIRFFKAKEQNIADEMLKVYKEKIREENVKLSKVVIPTTDNREEKTILKNAGFSMKLAESDLIIVSLSELSGMSVMKSRHIPDGVIPLREVTVRQFRNGIDRCLKKGKKGLCEDLKYLPVSYFEKDVSCCYEKDGELNSFLLFHQLPSETISIQLMICMDEDPKTILLGMIRSFVISMEDEYSPDTKVLLNRHNQASLLLAEKLLPRGFGLLVYEGSRIEM